jgi:hypothetical protein
VENANGWQTWGGKHNWEAISGNNRQGQIRAIGDQAIPWRAPHEHGITRLGQDSHLIAMHLPECHQIVGIDADCLAESRPILEDARAAITAVESQI